MLLRVEGVDLPGLPGVQVGVQRRAEVVERVPADAESAVWTMEVTTKPLPAGETDFGGPFIHGKRGARFVYLCWGSVTGADFHGFRRAKIHPMDAGAELIAAAVEGGGVLVARLGLTDTEGGPICATVRPPLVSWSVLGE